MKKELFIVSIFIFIMNSILVITNCYQPIDEIICNLVGSIQTGWLTDIFKVITVLGNTKTIIAVNALIIVITLFTRRFKLFVLPIASICSGAFNTALKYLFSRPRPVGIELIAQGGFSYPSGHSAISALFYGALVYLLMKSNFKYKKLLMILPIILMILIPLSRIYLGVHYLSDIIGGFSLGFSILSLILIIFDKVTTKER